jgi:hydrogenase maturation protease
MGEPTTLVLGYGNPGRQDDGLGPRLAAAVESWEVPGVRVDSAYQLQLEDVALLRDVARVIFLDADISQAEPWKLRRLAPEGGIDFTSHGLGPARVLGIAAEVLGARPEAWLFTVRGYCFEPFTESLSVGATDNFEMALPVLRDFLARLDQTAVSGA